MRLLQFEFLGLRLGTTGDLKRSLVEYYLMYGYQNLCGDEFIAF